MLTRLYIWLLSFLHPRPVRLAIVRRYADANGHYVGELYELSAIGGVSAYRQIGVSLDSLGYDVANAKASDFDYANDFLAPMLWSCIRIGALDPGENDRTRHYVATLPKGDMQIIIQNRFIEHVLQPQKGNK